MIPFGKANEVADAEYVRDVAYIPPCKNFDCSYEPLRNPILTIIDCPKEVENAPCHVQLIGRRLKDERLMQHAKIVESVLASKST